jgi:hypothetical protein
MIGVWLSEAMQVYRGVSPVAAAFLLKILTIINFLGSVSRSGTEVAVPMVLEQVWGQ